VHLISTQTEWYLVRASGVVAYLLLTGGVLLGLGLSGHGSSRRWPRFAVEEVHRFVGILTGVFVGLHVLTLLADTFLPFSLAQVTIPFASSYRPLWTALGIVAAELLVALAVTNHWRRQLPHRLWRRFHYVTFAVWAGATAHGLGSGTDRGTPWLLGIELASTVAVLGMLAWRLDRTAQAPARAR
jgi:sulfoxide reductase heme-binding subunit YedZ